VPIEWAEKEKYIQKIKLTSQDRSTQVNLPRMSFDIIGFEYDRERKKNTLIRNVNLNNSNSGSVYTAFTATPWDITFKLSIYARNVEDAGQIIEQILPYFQPDYTPTLQFIPNMNLPKDIPIILSGVQPEFDYDGGAVDSTRTVIFDLTFVMKVDFSGPVVNKKVIKKSITTVSDDTKFDPLKFTLGANTGFGAFIKDELVFQGPNKDEATAFGYVDRFNNNLRELYVTNYQGTFKTNTVIRSVTSNANFVLQSFILEPTPYVTMNVTPNPISANGNSQFGITITIT
jgi:hypothetical protein